MPAKKKPADERRSHPYQIRLTESEYQALDARAVAKGVNLSDMIREALGLPTMDDFRNLPSGPVIAALTGKSRK